MSLSHHTRGTRTYRFALLLFLLTAAGPMHAHLMVAQQGTLNFTRDGIYVVLSLPADAFTDLDANGDGSISHDETDQFRPAIARAVDEHISLRAGNRAITLQDLIVSPVQEHRGDPATVQQIVVMGVFKLEDANTPVVFYNGLYGKTAATQRLQLTAKHALLKQQIHFVVTPSAPTKTLLFDTPQARQ